MRHLGILALISTLAGCGGEYVMEGDGPDTQTRESGLYLSYENPWGTAAVEALVGFDPSNNNQWVLWSRRDTHECRMIQIGNSTDFFGNTTINLGPGHDRAFIIEQSAAQGLYCATPGGMTAFYLSTPIHPTTSARLNGQDGNDILLCGGADGTAECNGNSGDDYIQVRYTKSNANGGSGNDKIDAYNTKYQDTTLSGGEGDDCIEFQIPSPPYTDPFIRCGGGNDTVAPRFSSPLCWDCEMTITPHCPPP